MTGIAASLTQMKPEHRMTSVTEAGMRNAPAVTASKTTHIIAVASGIRGVGKSSIAALLATALYRQELAVGLFDTDSTGARILGMFSVHQHPTVSRQEEIAQVVSRGGVKLMTLNWLLPGDEQPIDEHDEVINNAIKHMWEDFACGHLDYLIVNLPPGTSDIALAVIQSLPLDGVVLVTSPRDTAEMALRETATMVKQLGIPLIGLVDNMRHVVCPACGTGIYVFGTGQAEFSAQLFKTEMLGRMRLDPELACLCDAGAVEDYRSAELDSIAEKVLQFVAKTVSKTTGKDRSADKSRGW